MILKLNTDQMELMRGALLREHTRLIQDFAGLHCVGYSAQGIEICRRKSEVEALLDLLNAPQPVLRHASEHPPFRTAVAAVHELAA